MAWEEELFGFLDDLEQQAEALYDAERAPELADRITRGVPAGAPWRRG